MKWIVVWVWIHILLVPCNYVSIPDEFGRIRDDNYIPAMACFKEERVPKLREFDTLEEARAFMKRGEKEKDLAGWEIWLRNDTVQMLYEKAK